MDKKFFSLKEVHSEIGGSSVVSLQHLYNIAKSGELPTLKLGHRILVPAWAVKKIMTGPIAK